MRGVAGSVPQLQVEHVGGDHLLVLVLPVLLFYVLHGGWQNKVLGSSMADVAAGVQ